MRKIISAILVIAMAVSMFVFPASAAPVTADTSWYDSSKTEFEIGTAAQLMGIAALNNSFAGKTIKLTADITVNEGQAASWANAAPETSWAPIRAFAGTFDGQGHTVSGLYGYAGSNMGMFASTDAAAIIKNFRLVNSYFKTDGGTCGGVSASGGGTYDTIYSDAIIECGDHHAGGIFGVCNSPVTVTNCWFDGSVTLVMRYGAGIVGNGNNRDVVIEHCLNTGKIRSEYTATANSHIAGISGRNDASTTIVDCLNTGLISSAYYDANGSDVIGSVFGCCGQNKKTEDGSAWISHLSITQSWGTYESCPYFFGTNASKDPDNVIENNMISDKLLVGYGAYFNTDLDFENYWAVNMSGAPILMSFAEEIPALYDVAIPEISKMEVKSEGHWGPRWTVTLKVPDGYKKEDITLGAVIVPTKALPDPEYLVSAADESFEYRGNVYQVANVEGKIIRESDENTVIATFVVTDLSEKTVRSDYTVRPYAVYKVAEGELTMYGASVSGAFYAEAKLTEDEAAKASLDVLMADVDAAIGPDFTVSRDWSTLDLFEQVPALVADGTKIKPAADYGAGNWVIEIDGTEEAFADYAALLEKNGFTRIVDNGENGLKGSVFTGSFSKGDLTVTVVDVTYKNMTYVSASYDQPVSEHLFDNFKDTAKAGARNVLHQVELYHVGNLYVIQLKNGHFIVSDGGTADEQDYLLTYLESLVPAGEKPVIEAWVVTHLHNDHFHVMNNFNKHPEWADRVSIEGYYFSEPSDIVKDQDPGVYAEIANEYKAITVTRTTKGTVPEVYRIHTGERYYFCDITMEIMLTQEQIRPAEYVNNFNDSSTCFLFTMDGQTFMNGGDGHRPTMQFLLDAYEIEDLQVDFFQLLHHGHNTWDEFTNRVGVFKTVLCPSDATAWRTTHSVKQANINLLDVAKEHFVAGMGTDVFYLPYTVGKTGTDGGHVKLPKQYNYHV